MKGSQPSKRLSIRHLRAFVAVAECRSLTRAAEALFVTQSALSLTVQHLEQHLGLQLFDRSTRRLDLTTAGDEFLPTARRLLHEFDSSIKEMRALGKRERGKLGVGAVPSVMALLLSEASASFIDKYPGIDLYLREDNSAAVQQRILSGDVDLGICSPLEPDNQLSLASGSSPRRAWPWSRETSPQAFMAKLDSQRSRSRVTVWIARSNGNIP